MDPGIASSVFHTLFWVFSGGIPFLIWYNNDKDDGLEWVGIRVEIDKNWDWQGTSKKNGIPV